MTVDASRPSAPSAWELYTPKLISVFREGYTLERLKRDAVAGFTVAMVALPLSMAIAKACGTSPERGLYTAVIGGLLISLFGGSRFQIGGPAGAFIVLIAATLDQHGLEGLFLATILAGVMLIALGALKLGTIIKYIPHPVLVGFTSGIAAIIFSSQLVDLFGLTLAGKEPGALLPKLIAIGGAASSFNMAAVLVSLVSVALIIVLRRVRPHWPGFLIAIALASVITVLLSGSGYSVATIGTAFGGIPSALPAPSVPILSLEKVIAVLPSALAFALLGAIESLLSAVVADGMSGRRHRSNCELVAQGIANIGSGLFGGIPATGTIARTATNIRAGATSPVSGIIHALALLLIMAVAAPLASYIPLSALAAVLAVVSWNMAERHEFAAILRRSRGDAIVLLVTFGLTIFVGVAEGIAAGVVLGSLMFMHRMAELVEVQSHINVLDEDTPDRLNLADDQLGFTGDDTIAVFRLSGPFFFGAASEVTAVLERIGAIPKVFVLDLSDVPFCDDSAAHALHGLVRSLKRQGMAVIITGAKPAISVVLARNGVTEPNVMFTRDLPSGVIAARAMGAATA